MTVEHVDRNAAIFDRIGTACDAIRESGYPEIATAIVRRARALRGEVRKAPLPLRAGNAVFDLMAEADRMAGLPPLEPFVDSTALVDERDDLAPVDSTSTAAP